MVNFSSAQVNPTTGAPEIPWPGLNEQIQQRPPIVPNPALYSAVFATNWLSAAGTVILIGDIVSLIVLRVGPGRALRIYGQSLN